MALNVMVAGPSGSGKSSLIEIVLAQVSIKEAVQKYNFKIGAGLTEIKPPTIGFDEKTAVLSKNGLKLTMVDSPGYGNKQDISVWLESLVAELVSRMDQFRADCMLV